MDRTSSPSPQSEPREPASAATDAESRSPLSRHSFLWTAAIAGVKRFLDGEAASLPLGNQPLEPTLDGDMNTT